MCVCDGTRNDGGVSGGGVDGVMKCGGCRHVLSFDRSGNQ